MILDTPRPPEPPEAARAALLAMIARLPDAAVARLLAVVWWWVAGPGKPPACPQS